MNDTSAMIARLAGQADRRGPSFDMRMGVAAAISVGLAGLVFFATIGPRVDFWSAAQTVRFLAKFVFTISLAATTLHLLGQLARPGAMEKRDWLWLLLPGGILALLLIGELLTVPSSQWATTMRGSNSLVCLTFVPLIGLGPLAALLVGLRQGAPTRPGLAGLVAGIAAGGMAATFYAAHCTDDSALFVVLWYGIAISGLGLVGAMLGRVFARF
jgi:hypothetical protein